MLSGIYYYELHLPHTYIPLAHDYRLLFPYVRIPHFFQPRYMHAPPETRKEGRRDQIQGQMKQ